MVVTNDAELARQVRMLRAHGIERRYYHELHGYNSRLDELQAAILRLKLKRLPAWNHRRAEIAARFNSGLRGLPLVLPVTAPVNQHVYHIYAVLTDQRDQLQKFLADHGVSTIIYYPLPLHLQRVYADLGYRAGDFPVAEAVSNKVLPLPMYPELTNEQVDYVIGSIHQFPF
jgi:dTDP-4-amino-4,6-dideoxygalactose transaminase